LLTVGKTGMHLLTDRVTRLTAVPGAWWGFRWVTLISSHERRIWQEIERRDAAGTEEVALPRLRPRPPHRLERRGADDLPAAIVSGVWASIVLVLLGFVLPGLAVGAATTLAAVLWRYWPALRG